MPTNWLYHLFAFTELCVNLDWRHKTGKSKILSTPGKKGEGGVVSSPSTFSLRFWNIYHLMRRLLISIWKSGSNSFVPRNEITNTVIGFWIKFLLEQWKLTQLEHHPKKQRNWRFNDSLETQPNLKGKALVTYLFGPDLFEYRTAEQSAKFPPASAKGKYKSYRATGDDSTLKINLRENQHGQLKFVNLKDSLATIVELRIKDDNGPEKKNYCRKCPKWDKVQCWTYQEKSRDQLENSLSQ